MSVQTGTRTLRRWSDAEDEWLRSHTDVQVKEAATHLGRTVGAVGQRRSKLGLASSRWAESRPWTDEELGFLQDHDDWPDKRLVKALGRSRNSVSQMKQRLRRGYVRKLDPWSDVENGILEELGQTLASTALAEYLPGRSPLAIQLQRYKLGIRSELGAGLAHQIAARPLLAKTCSTCGKLLQADWFSFRTSQRRWSSACRSCVSADSMARAKLSGRESHPETPEESSIRQKAYRERMRKITEPRAARGGEDYTEADYMVLADPDLTPLEKALRLERTWNAVISVCHKNGYRSHKGLGEPTDLWRIFNPNEEAA